MCLVLLCCVVCCVVLYIVFGWVGVMLWLYCVCGVVFVVLLMFVCVLCVVVDVVVCDFV